MWITNDDYSKLKQAVGLWYKNQYADVLSIEDKRVLAETTDLLSRLTEKRKRDNARCAAYIADKRKVNPEYAGNKHKKKD